MKQERKNKRRNSNEPIVITYPREVYFQGKLVAYQNQRGEIEFTDYKNGFKLMNHLKQKTYHTTDIDRTGRQTQFLMIVPMGLEEDLKASKVKHSINKKVDFGALPTQQNFKLQHNLTITNKNIKTT